MKSLTETSLKYLVGIVLAVIIGFLIYWFMIQTPSDEIAQKNANVFYENLKILCENPNKVVEFDFELPQHKVSSLKDQVENFFGTIASFFGFKSDIEIPFQAFNDPYYKIYWEFFPPEPPYEFGKGVIESVQSIFAPWYEDLPWSSNFMVTLSFNMMFFGLDYFGIGETFGRIKKAGRILAYKTFDKIKNVLDSKILPKLSKVFNALDKGKSVTEKIVTKTGRSIKITVKGGKFVIKEGKFIAGSTAVYTIFCWVTQDKTLGECLKEGVISSIGIDIGKLVIKKYAVPKIKKRFTKYLAKFGNKVRCKMDDFMSFFKKDVDEILESEEIKKILKNKGWKWDETNKYWIASVDDEIARENIINALEEFVKENGFPDSVDDFTFIYETKDGKKMLKEVVFKPKSLRETILDNIKYPFQKITGLIESKVMSNEMLAPEGLSIFLENMKGYFERDPEKALELLKLAGKEVKNSEEALRILKTRINRILKECDKGICFLVVESGSNLEKIIKDAAQIYEENPEGVIEVFSNYLDEIVKYKDEKEAKLLWNFLNGKKLRLREDIEKFSRGTFGYMLLRFQDIYTPLGATWWDRYYSYYGYKGEKLPYGWCQTSCDDNKLCLQLGACVRQYDFPEECIDKGIYQIRIKRDSIVAPNPRFYLVSPCKAKIRMYVKDDTIFVEPHLYTKYNNGKNYCYATSKFVSWYVGLEIGSEVVRCVSAVLCGLITAAPTGGYGILDGILSCIGTGKAYTGMCSIVSNLAGIVVDLHRETQLVWPDVYSRRPDLIDFIAS